MKLKNTATFIVQWGKAVFVKANFLKTIALSGLAILVTGCMQVRTHVLMNADGTVTITEHVRFSRPLLDLGGDPKSELNIPSLLEKPAALERMSQMGKGIQLISHAVYDTEGGARESKTVYKIPDLNDLHYHNYLLMYGDRNHQTLGRFSIQPVLTTSWNGLQAGDLAVQFHRTWRKGERTKPKPKPKDPPPAPKPPTPYEHQVLRELRPAFKDMMKGFHLQLTFESYAPLRSGYRYINTKRKQKFVHLINITDRQLDKHGGLLMDNEEVMLDLLRGDLSSKDMVTHVGGLIHFGSPHRRWTANSMILFRPTRPLFDKYLKGKTLKKNSKDKVGYPADFNQVGYKPEK